MVSEPRPKVTADPERLHQSAQSSSIQQRLCGGRQNETARHRGYENCITSLGFALAFQRRMKKENTLVELKLPAVAANTLSSICYRARRNQVSQNAKIKSRDYVTQMSSPDATRSRHPQSIDAGRSRGRRGLAGL